MKDWYIDHKYSHCLNSTIVNISVNILPYLFYQHTHLHILSLYLHTYIYICFRVCLVAQTVKDLPAMWETRVWTLDWEDPLEKEMATHSSILS